jgi:hypothetical protein
VIRGATIADRDIYLDRETYKGCVFYNCNMLFSGYRMHLVGSQMYGCRWILAGPAGNTIKALSMIYTQRGGTELVEAYFAEIRTFGDLRGGAN